MIDREVKGQTQQASGILHAESDQDGMDLEQCYTNLQSCLQRQSPRTNISQYFIVHTGNKVLLTIDNIARRGNAVYYIHTFQALPSIPHTTTED